MSELDKAVDQLKTVQTLTEIVKTPAGPKCQA